MRNLLSSLVLSHCTPAALAPWPELWLGVFAPCTSCFLPPPEPVVWFVHQIQKNDGQFFNNMFPLSFTLSCEPLTYTKVIELFPQLDGAHVAFHSVSMSAAVHSFYGGLLVQ